MIQLDKLIATHNMRILKGENQTINEIQLDSRNVNLGDAFVALQGTSQDGHEYISSAIERGAKVIFLEKTPTKFVENVTYVQMEHGRKDTAMLASSFYKNPSSQLSLIGVTGTNGKTTISTLLYNLFMELGYKCGLISTVENLVDGERFDSTHTTPDPFEINRLLSYMVERGCEYVFMEVSSHAIDQDRVYSLEFKGRIFTNITHDHLDYHGDFKSYIKAKKKFFDEASKQSFALVNADDKNGSIMLQNSSALKKTYGLKSLADYHAKIVDNSFSGLHLVIDNESVHFKLVGKFNAYNLLAVYGTAMELDQDKLEVLRILSILDSAEGRFDVLVDKRKVTAIVDYAHTPDAMENVLATISDMLKPGNGVITVFGCGGDRDKSKRHVMAQVACKYSQKVIFTSDNPRSESPSSIIDDMMKGVPVDKLSDVLTIEDRKSAIKSAVAIARSGDVVLVAGKGHETYQEIKGVKYPFEDKKVLKEALSVL